MTNFRKIADFIQNLIENKTIRIDVHLEIGLEDKTGNSEQGSEISEKRKEKL